MPLHKAQIVQTALEVLDRDGLDGVTLRRLAQELDVKAASIYWHIPNKSSLLDEMANTILVEHFGDLDVTNDRRDWAEWLATLAHELRAAMLKRREGARVVAGAHPDVAVMLVTLWDLTVRVLHNAGFSANQAVTAMLTVVNFTFGSVIEEQASPPYGQKPGQRDVMAVMGDFPVLAAASTVWEGSNDTMFATGVRILIRGVRAELAPSLPHEA